MIATIGSLGNGGLVAVFGIIYLPFLPQIGKYIKILCFVATLLVSFGFALAAVNNGVSSLLASRSWLDIDNGTSWRL